MSERPRGPYFHLVGFLGGRAMTAQWKDGRLTGDPELLDAAQTLVARGERFSAQGAAVPVAASLEAPLPAALTMMRCLQGITQAELVFDAPETRLEITVESGENLP